jgi:Epoxide hydrolase N terminus
MTHLAETTMTDLAVRPFRINVPEAALVDLRRRVAATRWPDRETVTDQSQGVQLAKIQELVRYWGTDHDWRKVEAKLNALPQFATLSQLRHGGPALGYLDVDDARWCRDDSGKPGHELFEVVGLHMALARRSRRERFNEEEGSGVSMLWKHSNSGPSGSCRTASV